MIKIRLITYVGQTRNENMLFIVSLDRIARKPRDASEIKANRIAKIKYK